MSNLVYPGTVRGLTWTVLKSPSLNTSVQEAPSGDTVRIAQRYNPIWHWELIYEYLKSAFFDVQGGFQTTDFETWLGFFLARQGQYDDFLFTDPSDRNPFNGQVCYVGPAMISSSPNLGAQLQVVTDGAGNYYSPIQRYWGLQFFEDITDLNGAITVYANGVLQTLTTDYTIGGPGLVLPGSSFIGLYLQWVAGAPASPVTAQFNYYYRVAFESDAQDLEQFMQYLWTIGGEGSKNGAGFVKLKTSRPNPST